ncbi:hypothetical protein RUM43_003917 [Polyplax serrata]|uniref:Mucosa-associated lymphoid tissue lymphoma translocation protein 1 n=1 Tax=Polyplax serrata TaxID=468196 RepID=A0AAN8PP53_POLSC
MEFINFEAVLIPENLSFHTYNQLLLLLDEDQTWRCLADYFQIFSESDIHSLSKNAKPAEKFLYELGSRLCTIEIFCNALEKCGLFNIVMLFKEHVPLQIIEETVTSDYNSTQMVVFGTDITLCAKAVGLPPPEYQWFHDNVELSGENEPTLTLHDFGMDSEGDYYCVIKQHGYESIISKSVALILAPERPTIISQPEPELSCFLGSSVNLTIKADGHPNLCYQWYKGNHQLDKCTSPSLTMDIKDKSQAGIYRCYIHNSAGEVWSNETKVKINDLKNLQPSAKLALLISNHLYDNLNTLYKPENDVKTLADALKDHGFLVIALQNLSLIEMRNAICTFASLLPPDAYIVFYFAGHGFEMHGKFMLPVDTPGPDDYLHTDGICERELLKTILSTNPKLFLELLDMCLKPPNPSNKKIFQETPDLYEYEANNNLIQGYSTTSYLGAYEKKTGKNGLYVEHIKRYLSKEQDLTIVEILQKVAKDVASVCVRQKPFFGTNVTMDYRLSDKCQPNSWLTETFRRLSLTPKNFKLNLKAANVESEVTFSPYLNVFLNTLEIRFTNLTDYRVTCEALGETCSFVLYRNGNDLFLNVMSLQRLKNNKILTLILTKNEEKIDSADIDIGKPMIAVADLWSAVLQSTNELQASQTSK